MNGQDQRIVIVDLRIPFMRLVLFFVKATLAAIPAAIIVGICVMVLTALLATAIGIGNWQMMMQRWSF